MATERVFFISEGSRLAAPGDEIKIEDLSKGDEVLTAAGWGRVKPATVKMVSSMVFDGYLACIETVSGRRLYIPLEHTVFSRVDFKGRTHLVCLTRNFDGHYHVGLFRGDPMMNGPEEVESAWILKVCRNRHEAAFFYGFYAFKYGIPYQEFAPDTFFLEREDFERYMEEIDTPERARKLFRSEQIDQAYPHFDRAAAGQAAGYKLMDLVMYGEQEATGGTFDHRLHLRAHNGRPPHRSKSLSSHLPVDHPWKMRNVEVSKADYDELLLFAQTLASLENVKMRFLSQLTVNEPFSFYPASNVVSGMMLAGLHDDRVEEMVVRDLSFVTQKGPLFALRLEGGDNCIIEDVVIPCR